MEPPLEGSYMAEYSDGKIAWQSKYAEYALVSVVVFPEVLSSAIEKFSNAYSVVIQGGLPPYTRIAVARSIAGCKLDRDVNADSLNMVGKLRGTVDAECDEAETNKCAVSGMSATERIRLRSIAKPTR